MINKDNKIIIAERRAKRQRFKLKQNSSRPRLVFNKSNKYLMAQIIDDVQGRTLAFAISSEKSFPIQNASKKNITAAKELGKVIASRAKEKGIKQVMLDRSGMIYHGKIAAFAESAREGGLEF